MPLDSLEYIVRPYQSPNAHGTVLIPSTPSTTRQKATLTWGATATMPTPTAPPTTTYNWQCCGENLTEKSRKNDTVTLNITTSDDGTGSIDLQRPNTVTLAKQAKNRCLDPLEQQSYVAQGVNEVLSEWDSEFAGRTETPEDNCRANWYLNTA